MLCKADEAGTDFLSTFFTFDLNFRNFKDWVTFHSDILLGSLSRDPCDFTASHLNNVHDLNCKSFFILWSSLPLIIGTFVTESTVSYRTRHSFQEYSNKGAFCDHIASKKMCLFDFFTVKRLTTLSFLTIILSY